MADYLDPNDPRFHTEGGQDDPQLDQARQFGQQWMNERGIPASWGTVDDYVQRYQSLRQQGRSFDDARQGAINELGWDKPVGGAQASGGGGGGGNRSGNVQQDWQAFVQSKGYSGGYARQNMGQLVNEFNSQYGYNVKAGNPNASGLTDTISLDGGNSWVDVIHGGDNAWQWNVEGAGGGGGNMMLSAPDDLTQGFNQQFQAPGGRPDFQPFEGQFNAPGSPQFKEWTEQFQAPGGGPPAWQSFDESFQTPEDAHYTYSPFDEKFQAPEGAPTFAPWTEQFRAPTAEEARQTPGYEFTLQQGLQGIDRGAAAKGTLLTMGNQEARGQYATGLADQTYNDVYARAAQEYQDRLQAYNLNLQNQSSLYNDAYSRAMQEYGNRFNIFNTNVQNQRTSANDAYQRAMQEYANRFNVFETNQQGQQGAYSNAFNQAMQEYQSRFNTAQYNTGGQQQQYANDYNAALQRYQTAFNQAQYNNQGAAQAYQQSYQNAMQEYMNAFNIFNTNQTNEFNRYYSLANLGLGAASGQAGAAQNMGNAGGTAATNAGNVAGSSTIANGNLTSGILQDAGDLLGNSLNIAY